MMAGGPSPVRHRASGRGPRTAEIIGREGGVTDIYDRHSYDAEDRRIMGAVAAHIIAIAEGTESNVVRLR